MRIEFAHRLKDLEVLVEAQRKEIEALKAAVQAAVRVESRPTLHLPKKNKNDR